MTTEPTIDKVLPFSSFEKRVALIKNDIFTDFVSSADYSKVPFYKVLDRLIILLQYPVSFFLFKETNGYKRFFYNFLQDPIFSTQVKEQRETIENSLDKYLFRIFDTQYYLVVFTIEKENKKTTESHSVLIPIESPVLTSIKPRNITTIEQYIQWSCKYIFGHIPDEKIQIKSSYGKLIKKSLENTTAPLNIIDNKDGEINFSCNETFFKNFKENYFNELNGIRKNNNSNENENEYDYIFIDNSPFNSTFNKLNRRLYLTEKMTEEFLSFEKMEKFKQTENYNNKYQAALDKDDFEEKIYSKYDIDLFKDTTKFKKLSNLFFSIRYYDKNKITRFFNNAGYNYNISYIIPKDQEDDIRSFLDYIKPNKKTGETSNFFKRNKSYVEYYTQHLSRKEKLDNKDLIDKIENLDKQFWETITGDDGVNECINIIRAEIGNETRSINDRAYSDGLLTFYTPFDRGGINRVAQSSPTDQIRTVFFYYAALGSLPVLSKNQYIGSILSPVLIGDSVFGVCVHFVVMENPKTSFVSKKIWFTNYRYANSVSESAERNIAREIRGMYFNILQEIYKQEFRVFIYGLLEKIPGIKNKNTIEVFKTNIKERFEILSRFFPYSSVEIKVNISKVESLMKNEIYFFNKKGTLIFSELENKFYPKPTAQIYNIKIEKEILPAFYLAQKQIEEIIEDFLIPYKYKYSGE